MPDYRLRVTIQQPLNIADARHYRYQDVAWQRMLQRLMQTTRRMRNI